MSDQTRITASCPFCGDVELTPPQVRLRVWSVEQWCHYSFDCPECREEIRRPASPDVVRLLVSGGVVAVRQEVPGEALEEHDGPPIRPDDILDFVLGLDSTDELAARAEADRG